MNVANLELCKELYELSGWDFTGREKVMFFYDESDSLTYSNNYSGLDEGYIPAYDLGYLLRKLPIRIAIGKRDGYDKNGKRIDDLYQVYDSSSAINWMADTPENALCKLAIELFKQGVLVKDAA